MTYSAADSDALHITGIRAYGYTGFLPEEQKLGQWYEVNLTLWVDMAESGKSDRLEDTYDYRQIIQTTQSIIRTQRFKLIESLTETIAQKILTLGGVERVRVRLTKLNPPIADFSGQVSIEIVRTVS